MPAKKKPAAEPTEQDGRPTMSPTPDLDAPPTPTRGDGTPMEEDD